MRVCPAVAALILLVQCMALQPGDFTCALLDRFALQRKVYLVREKLSQWSWFRSGFATQ